MYRQTNIYKYQKRIIKICILYIKSLSVIYDIIFINIYFIDEIATITHTYETN